MGSSIKQLLEFVCHVTSFVPTVAIIIIIDMEKKIIWLGINGRKGKIRCVLGSEELYREEVRIDMAQLEAMDKSGKHIRIGPTVGSKSI